MTGTARASETPALPAEDAVIVFRTVKSGVSGRLVRLGAVAETILRRHALPELVSVALGESLVLAGLLGSALGANGSISIQTRTDGVVSVLYADCEAPGKLRGYARFDAETLSVLAESGEKLDPGSILGDGHLAITIDPGEAGDRYQGVVAMDGGPLAMGASAYFESRENLPTFVHLAVAQHYSIEERGQPAVMRWRGGGMMIQSLGGSPQDGDFDETGNDDNPWLRVRMLAATVEDHELLDPSLTPERLLLRLFHEEGVIIERVVPLSSYCKCSRERVSSVLQSFGRDELTDMQDANGTVAVTCEFCAATYAFALADIASQSDAQP